MKKPLSLILAFVMCLSFCACGGVQNGGDSQEMTTAEPTAAEILNFDFYWLYLNGTEHTVFLRTALPDPLALRSWMETPLNALGRTDRLTVTR